MLQVTLNPGLPDGNWAVIGPLCGVHESRHNDTVTLLDTLLVEVPGTSVLPGRAQDLALCDCDRLIGAVYKREFGDAISGSSLCTGCGEPFDLNFSLSLLLQDLQAANSELASGPDELGVYTLSDGCRFRLPTLGDQFAVAGMEPVLAIESLLKRCVPEGHVPDRQLLQNAMAEIGATADLELDADCPHCGKDQGVHFDLQRYLLHSLSNERKFLQREIHTIALAYGWSRHEILDLTRQERRTFARLILAERQVSMTQSRRSLS